MADAKPPVSVRCQPDVALAEALAGAVQRPPCLIAFSGGRDSSLLLAAALRAARAHNAPSPVPITLSFNDAQATQEEGWQERVLAHLRPSDRIEVALEGELELLGPVAIGALRRLGPYEPANAHFVLPMLAHARGGSLVLGVGGDELLAPGRWAHLRGLRAHPRPWRTARALGALIATRAPGELDARRLARRAPALRWITPEARGRAALRWAHEHADPVRFDAHVRRAALGRAVRNGLKTLRALGASDDVMIHAPLLAPEVVDALATAGGALGFGSRAAATRALAGQDALPEALLVRRSKASFGEVLWGPECSRFANEWSGAGFDPRVIDADALRNEWRAEHPDFRSALLLHAAWYHDQCEPDD